MTLNALFVYGTLMRGEPSHGRLRGVRRIAEASVQGLLFDLGYPALVLGEGTVFGELCWFDDLEALLPELDAYEGYDQRDPEGSLYLREVVDVTLEPATPEPSTTRLRAWCYLMRAAPSGAVQFPSGRWR